jgi:hypothetical protein
MDLLSYKPTWNSMWCKDEELEFGIVFRGTKLGEGQLVCGEAPMLEWRNFLWIQLEKFWSCMVFIVGSINLSRITLWRRWIELEVVFIHCWRFKSLAQVIETKLDALLRLWMIKARHDTHLRSSSGWNVSIFDLKYRYAVLSRGMHHIMFWFSFSAQVTQVSWER